MVHGVASLKMNLCVSQRVPSEGCKSTYDYNPHVCA